MSYHIIRPATHDEWLEERKKGIGASEAGTVMGCSPFKTPMKLFLQKTGRAAPEPETPAMREGHWLEYATAAAFEELADAVIDPSTLGDWIAVDDEHDCLRVSPDRCYWPASLPPELRTPENWCVLELKSTNKPVDPENPPMYWILQLQYQMGVLGAKHGALCWIDKSARAGEPAINFKLYEFKPNTWLMLRDKLLTFWYENIMKDIQPDPITGEDALLKYPYATAKKTVPATQQLETLISEYKTLKQSVKSTEERIETIESEIKITIGDADTLVSSSGATLATWRNRSMTVFNEDDFKTKHPDYYNVLTHPVFDLKMLEEEDPKLYKEFCQKIPSASRTLRVT